MGRPVSKNVFYFPHYTGKPNRELDLIEYKHGSEGYKAYYKLLELVADAEYHRLLLRTQDDKDMFELGMNCQKEVVADVIRILLSRGKIDKESWENERPGPDEYRTEVESKYIHYFKDERLVKFERISDTESQTIPIYSFIDEIKYKEK